MTQTQWYILLFKIALIADAAAIVVFVADYTRLSPWWRQPIGQTIVIKDILLFIPVMLSVLSIFFHFNRTTSQVAAWMTVVSFGLIGPVLLWRTVVFERIHRQKSNRASSRSPGRPGKK